MPELDSLQSPIKYFQSTYDRSKCDLKEEPLITTASPKVGLVKPSKNLLSLIQSDPILIQDEQEAGVLLQNILKDCTNESRKRERKVAQASLHNSQSKSFELEENLLILKKNISQETHRAGDSRITHKFELSTKKETIPDHKSELKIEKRCNGQIEKITPTSRKRLKNMNFSRNESSCFLKQGDIGLSKLNGSQSELASQTNRILRKLKHKMEALPDWLTRMTGDKHVLNNKSRYASSKREETDQVIKKIKKSRSPLAAVKQTSEELKTIMRNHNPNLTK